MTVTAMPKNLELPWSEVLFQTCQKKCVGMAVIEDSPFMRNRYLNKKGKEISTALPDKYPKGVKA